MLLYVVRPSFVDVEKEGRHNKLPRISKSVERLAALKAMFALKRQNLALRLQKSIFVTVLNLVVGIEKNLELHYKNSRSHRNPNEGV